MNIISRVYTCTPFYLASLIESTPPPVRSFAFKEFTGVFGTNLQTHGVSFHFFIPATPSITEPVTVIVNECWTTSRDPTITKFLNSILPHLNPQ